MLRWGRSTTSLMLVVVLTAGVFLAGYGAGARTATARSAEDQGFALLRELLARIRSDYLNPIPDPSKLFDGAARGLLDALGDPFTRYMDAQAFREFRQTTEGFFFGIGIFIDIRDRQLIVVQPIEGTPAHKAGLRAGDKILLIDTVSTDGMAIQEAVSRIRGPAGTRVKLRILRDGQSLDVEITRARIQMVTVQGAGALDEAVRKDLAASRLGYLRIARFDEPTAKEVAAELTQILKSNPMGILIDLRGNGGGLLDVSEEVANRFIPADRAIVHVVDRQGKRATVRADRGSKIRLPLVVLVNEFSASASEIVAGALKDSAEATVVGMPTFGKGVIQTIYPLQGGGGAAITTAKYLTPSGRDIHGKGISPDVQVGDRLEGKNEAEVTRIQMEQLRRAIELLKQRVGQRR